MSHDDLCRCRKSEGDNSEEPWNGSIGQPNSPSIRGLDQLQVRYSSSTAVGYVIGDARTRATLKKRKATMRVSPAIAQK